MSSPSRDQLKQAQDKLDFLRIIKARPKANIAAAAKLVHRTSPLLAGQMADDLAQCRATGNIRLFGEPAP